MVTRILLSLILLFSVNCWSQVQIPVNQIPPAALMQSPDIFLVVTNPSVGNGSTRTLSLAHLILSPDFISAVGNNTYNTFYSTNLYSTSLFTTNLYATFAYSSNFFTTTFYSTNLYSTSLFTTNLYATFAYSSNFFTTNFYSTTSYTSNLFTTTFYSTNLYSTISYISNIFVTNIYAQNLNGNGQNITNIQYGNITGLPTTLALTNGAGIVFTYISTNINGVITNVLLSISSSVTIPSGILTNNPPATTIWTNQGNYTNAGWLAIGGNQTNQGNLNILGIIYGGIYAAPLLTNNLPASFTFTNQGNYTNAGWVNIGSNQTNYANLVVNSNITSLSAIVTNLTINSLISQNYTFASASNAFYFTNGMYQTYTAVGSCAITNIINTSGQNAVGSLWISNSTGGNITVSVTATNTIFFGSSSNLLTIPTHTSWIGSFWNRSGLQTACADGIAQ